TQAARLVMANQMAAATRTRIGVGTGAEDRVMPALCRVFAAISGRLAGPFCTWADPGAEAKGRDCCARFQPGARSVEGRPLSPEVRRGTFRPARSRPRYCLLWHWNRGR